MVNKSPVWRALKYKAGGFRILQHKNIRGTKPKLQPDNLARDSTQWPFLSSKFQNFMHMEREFPNFLGNFRTKKNMYVPIKTARCFGKRKAASYMVFY